MRCRACGHEHIAADRCEAPRNFARVDANDGPVDVRCSCTFRQNAAAGSLLAYVLEDPVLAAEELAEYREMKRAIQSLIDDSGPAWRRRHVDVAGLQAVLDGPGLDTRRAK